MILTSAQYVPPPESYGGAIANVTICSSPGPMAKPWVHGEIAGQAEQGFENLLLERDAHLPGLSQSHADLARQDLREELSARIFADIVRPSIALRLDARRPEGALDRDCERW